MPWQMVAADLLPQPILLPLCLCHLKAEQEADSFLLLAGGSSTEAKGQHSVARSCSWPDPVMSHHKLPVLERWECSVSSQHLFGLNTGAVLLLLLLLDIQCSKTPQFWSRLRPFQALQD